MQEKVNDSKFECPVAATFLYSLSGSPLFNLLRAAKLNVNLVFALWFFLAHYIYTLHCCSYCLLCVCLQQRNVYSQTVTMPSRPCYNTPQIKCTKITYNSL